VSDNCLDLIVTLKDGFSPVPALNLFLLLKLDLGIPVVQAKNIVSVFILVIWLSLKLLLGTSSSPCSSDNRFVYGGFQDRGDMGFDILGDVFLKNVYAVILLVGIMLIIDLGCQG
jgi:hypothetical protein